MTAAEELAVLKKELQTKELLLRAYKERCEWYEKAYKSHKVLIKKLQRFVKRTKSVLENLC